MTTSSRKVTRIAVQRLNGLFLRQDRYHGIEYSTKSCIISCCILGRPKQAKNLRSCQPSLQGGRRRDLTRNALRTAGVPLGSSKVHVDLKRLISADRSSDQSFNPICCQCYGWNETSSPNDFRQSHNFCHETSRPL